jgi:small conductance mechanosensitive channel
MITRINLLVLSLLSFCLLFAAAPAHAQDTAGDPAAVDVNVDVAVETSTAEPTTAADASAAAAARITQQMNEDPLDVNAWLAIFLEFGLPIVKSIALGLLILLITWFVAGRVSRIIRNRGDKSEKLDSTLFRFFASIARYAILAIGFVAALDVVGVGTASFAALIAAAGLAVGLALQGSLSNFAAGVMILLFRPYKVGNYITAGGESGTVDEIQLLTTTLDTPDNVRVIVPNSMIFSGTITNYSHHPVRRCDVEVGTEYRADLDRVRAVLEGVIEEIDERVVEKESMVFLAGLGASSIDWVVRIWVPASNFWPLKQKITALIKKRLDENGIGIPFPQMDVHLDKVD